MNEEHQAIEHIQEGGRTEDLLEEVAVSVVQAKGVDERDELGVGVLWGMGRVAAVRLCIFEELSGGVSLQEGGELLGRERQLVEVLGVFGEVEVRRERLLNVRSSELVGEGGCREGRLRRLWERSSGLGGNGWECRQGRLRRLLREGERLQGGLRGRCREQVGGWRCGGRLGGCWSRLLLGRGGGCGGCGEGICEGKGRNGRWLLGGCEGMLRSGERLLGQWRGGCSKGVCRWWDGRFGRRGRLWSSEWG